MEIFSVHARERMRSRSISEQQVIVVLSQPDRRYLGSRGNMIAEKAFGPATFALYMRTGTTMEEPKEILFTEITLPGAVTRRPEIESEVVKAQVLQEH